MSARTPAVTPVSAAPRKPARKSGRWWRFAALAVVAVVVLVPLAAVVALSVLPALGSTATGPTVENYVTVFTQTDVTRWVGNSHTPPRWPATP